MLRKLLAESLVREARFSFAAVLQSLFHYRYPEFRPVVRFADPLRALLIACVRLWAALSRSVVDGESVKRGRVLQFSVKRSVNSSWLSVLIRNFFGDSLDRET